MSYGGQSNGMRLAPVTAARAVLLLWLACCAALAGGRPLTPVEEQIKLEKDALMGPHSPGVKRHHMYKQRERSHHAMHKGTKRHTHQARPCRLPPFPIGTAPEPSVRRSSTTSGASSNSSASRRGSDGRTRRARSTTERRASSRGRAQPGRPDGRGSCKIVGRPARRGKGSQGGRAGEKCRWCAPSGRGRPPGARREVAPTSSP